MLLATTCICVHACVCVCVCLFACLPVYVRARECVCAPTQSGMDTRKGTNVDADAAERTFSALGYKIKRKNDQTVGEMETLLRNGTGKHHAALKLNQSPEM